MPTRIALLLGLAFALSGCGALSTTAPPAYEAAQAAGPAEPGSDGYGRFETHAATQTLSVEDIGIANAEVRSLVASFGGRISSARTGDEDRSHFRLQIPAESLLEALDAFAELGEERHRRIDSEDVTERFADTKARRENLASLRDRLRSLLDRAKTVEDVLRVERELTRVQTELDALDGRLLRLREDIALSRIELSLEQLGTEEDPGAVGLDARRHPVVRTEALRAPRGNSLILARRARTERASSAPSLSG